MNSLRIEDENIIITHSQAIIFPGHESDFIIFSS